MEDYEKKYKDVLAKAREIHRNEAEKRFDMEWLFPEIKESEDERIRKELIEQVIYIVPNNDEVDNEGNVLPTYQKRIDKYRAWLEKQGEHANFRSKIQIGDKVTRNDSGVLVNLSQFERVAKKAEKQEQKPEWSDEDEKNVTNILKVFSWYFSKLQEKTLWPGEKEKAICFLKSLKNRIQPQPKQEWSEEDKKLIDDTCHLINTLASGYGKKVTEPITFSGTQMIASIKDRLRALVEPRPQNHWQPSDEQMDALRYVFQHYLPTPTDTLAWDALKTIELMLDQLKELRKE